MTLEYIRYAIARRRVDSFRQAYHQAAAILQADQRCLAYELYQSLVEPTRFLVRIECRDAEQRDEAPPLLGVMLRSRW